jgi:hypothetical protein
MRLPKRSPTASPSGASALLQEALDVNASLGYQQTYELVGMTLVAARLANRCLTARLACPTIRHLHWMGERPMLTGIFNVAARALADSDPQAAAVIQGAARTFALAATTGSSTPGAPRVTDTGTDFFVETRRETTGLLIGSLGDDRRRELHALGAAMDGDDAVAFALAHVDMLLAHAGPGLMQAQRSGRAITARWRPPPSSAWEPHDGVLHRHWASPKPWRVADSSLAASGQILLAAACVSRVGASSCCQHFTNVPVIRGVLPGAVGAESCGRDVLRL